MSNSIMTQSARMNEVRQVQPAAPADLGPEIASQGKSEDLYLFQVKHVTLKKGQRMVLPVAEYAMKYKDVYTLDVPVTPPPEVMNARTRALLHGPIVGTLLRLAWPNILVMLAQASTGLIEVKPRRGATVANATSAQLETLFAAMAEIEAACARLAAMSMTPIERRRLQNLHDSMAAFVPREERDAYAAANIVFHTQIYAGAHNEILSEFATGLRRRLAPFRRAQFRSEGRLARSHSEHAAVVKAILACDAATAHALIEASSKWIEPTGGHA